MTYGNGFLGLAATLYFCFAQIWCFGPEASAAPNPSRRTPPVCVNSNPSFGVNSSTVVPSSVNPTSLVQSLGLADTYSGGGSFSLTPAEIRARQLHQRLTGAILQPSDPRYAAIVDAVQHGLEVDAANLATEHPGFLNSTVRAWAATLLTQGQNPLLELNDSLALVMGATRDNLDARLLLTGDFSYGRTPRLGSGRPTLRSNQLYDEIEMSSRDAATLLHRYSPQWNLAAARESAGLFTTRWWSMNNYQGGTNRVVVPNLMASFLCREAGTWKEPNLDPHWIRQDIDRFPQQNTRIFQTQCRSCHSPMDAMAGAFSKIDFMGDRIVWSSTVRPKYLKNATVYPDGHITDDNSWSNLLTTSVLEQVYGWGSVRSGSGIQSFAQSIADSRLYSECLSLRAFKQVCGGRFNVRDKVIVDTAANFRNSGYGLKDLFTAVAAHPACDSAGGI